MSKLTRGGLAIQIKSFSGNEGIVLTTIKEIGSIRYMTGVTLDSWLCDVGANRTAMYAPGLHLPAPRIRSIPTSWLRPVSGLPDTEDTTTDTPIKELA